MTEKMGFRRGAACVVMGAFVLLGLAGGVFKLRQGELSRGLLGFASAAFLVAPVFIKRWMGGHPHLLYIECFAFSILAYDIGCVFQQFDAVPLLDKVSHFLSGFVFTTLGYCLFLLLRGSRPAPEGRPLSVGVCFAVFFSSFVAVFWEICEFLGFVLTGHDSQHHLTTGVFDTMGDLITCFVGSLLCGTAILLSLKGKLRTPSGAVVGEFLDLLQANRVTVKR